jgi:hypothetical protein
MEPDERALALAVLAAAWERVAAEGASLNHAHAPIAGVVRACAAELPARHPEVSTDYAHHLGEAALWYLDRAVRRVADPDLDGRTSGQRASNLAWFGVSATFADLERLFAVAVALNADDA